MINKSMELLGKQPSVIRDIHEYSVKRKAEIGENNVFDFTIGNPSIPAPDEVRKTIIDLLSNKDSVELHGYTSDVGSKKTRESIANTIKSRFDFETSYENIYMTCGAAASLQISIKAICNEGDEVIILSPYFPEYKVYIENVGAVAVEVLCRSNDFGIDISAINRALTNRTKAIIINSPNNPSGVVFSKKDISELSKLLNDFSEKTNEPIYIIADEPYREIVYWDVCVPYIPSIYDNTIVCYSYSKSLSLPGERIGYIMVSPKAENSNDIFAAICGAGRASGYICAPSLMQYVIEKCSNLLPDVDKYAKNRDLLYNSLTEIGYNVIRPDGAFYLFVEALESDANKFCEIAKKHELLLVPSDSFGVKGFVRIAYCVCYEQIKNSITAFKDLYNDYK